MPKLPVVNAKKVVKIILKLDFEQHGQMKGSHLILKHLDGRRTTIPMHGKDIPTGTLMAILRDIKISKEEFLKLLKNKK